jgi:hypothetical protein
MDLIMNPIKHIVLRFIELNAFQLLIPNIVHINNSVLFSFKSDLPNFIEAMAVSSVDEQSTRRQKTVCHYMMKLFNAHPNLAEACEALNDKTVVFQGDDNPHDIPSLSWQTKDNYTSSYLLPDLYHVEANGYQEFFRKDRLTWSEKKPLAFWRGSTTGNSSLTTQNLSENKRYCLCKIGQQIPDLTDFKIINVVQSASDKDHANILSRLNTERLLSERISIDNYEKYKYIIDIDGNGNSWEIIRRLELGSCILKVDSPWSLWHYSYLKPWIHYIPIAIDLSDLHEKLKWCVTNDSRAREIAMSGRALATSLDFENEMKLASMGAVNYISAL